MAYYNYVKPNILGNIKGSFDFYCDSIEQFRFTWRISEQNWALRTTDIEWTLEGRLTEKAPVGEYRDFEGMGYSISNYTSDYPSDTNVSSEGYGYGTDDNFRLVAGEDWKPVLSGVHKLTGALTPTKVVESGGRVTFQPNLFTVKFWWGMNSNNSYSTNVYYRPCLPWAYITNAPSVMYDTQTIEIEYYVPCVDWGTTETELNAAGVSIGIFGYDEYGTVHLTRRENMGMPSKIGFYKCQSSYSTIDDFEYQQIQNIMGERTSASGYVELATYLFNSGIDGVFQSAIQPTYSYSFDTTQKNTSSIVINLSDNAPALSPTIEDVNPVSVALTGDKTKLILNVSNAKVTANAVGQKGASIEYVSITYKDIEFETNEYTFEAVQEAKFKIIARDNRKVVTAVNFEPEYVPYIPATTKIASNSASGTGEMVLKVDGLFWNGNFGKKTNSLNVYFRLRKASEADFGSWTKMTDITYKEDDGTYEASYKLTGLDYMATYVFQAYAEDAVAKYYAPELTLATTPVFDWGQRDFNFNVPVTIQGSQAATKTDLDNLREEVSPKDGGVLWEGSAIMNENEVITLSEPISQQNTGILLVFGNVDTDYSAIGGQHLFTYFLPKQWVTLGIFDDYFHHCPIVESSITIRSKTFKFTDTQIIGHTWNDADGYTSWRLMYVIGV